MKRFIIAVIAVVMAAILIMVGLNVNSAKAADSQKPVLVSTKNFYRPCVLDEKGWVGIKVDVVVRTTSIASSTRYWIRKDGSTVRVEFPYTNNLPFCYTVDPLKIPKKWFRK